jgi:hypothetical protein
MVLSMGSPQTSPRELLPGGYIGNFAGSFRSKSGLESGLSFAGYWGCRIHNKEKFNTSSNSADKSGECGKKPDPEPYPR